MRDHPTSEWQALPAEVRVAFWTGLAVSGAFHGLCLLGLALLYSLPSNQSGLPLGSLVMLLELTLVSVYNTARNAVRFIRALS